MPLVLFLFDKITIQNHLDLKKEGKMISRFIVLKDYHFFYFVFSLFIFQLLFGCYTSPNYNQSFYHEKAWEATKQRNKIWDYENFIKNSPQSPHKQEAMDFLEKLSLERARATRSPQHAEYYLKYFPNSPNYDEISKILITSIFKEAMEPIADREKKEQFISIYPNTEEAMIVRKDIESMSLIELEHEIFLKRINNFYNFEIIIKENKGIGAKIIDWKMVIDKVPQRGHEKLNIQIEMPDHSIKATIMNHAVEVTSLKQVNIALPGKSSYIFRQSMPTEFIKQKELPEEFARLTFTFVDANGHRITKKAGVNLR
jgi:hypothetical protein